MTQIAGMDMPTTMDAMEAMLRGMAPAEKAELDTLTQSIGKMPWIPQIGPQMTAYFHQADELLYGGAAGGGKSDLVIGLATTAHEKSLIFRRQSVDLDGLWDRLAELTGENWSNTNSVKKRMALTDGRVIEMGHLEVNGSEKTWQGRPHDLIAFDEAAQLDELKVNFVTQWLRTTTAGQRCRVVFATNPPIPDMKDGKMVDVSTGDWLKRWFAPWIDPKFSNPAKVGELRWCYMVAEGDRLVTRWVENEGWYNTDTGEEVTNPDEHQRKTLPLAKAKSRTFIKSLVDDNAFLKDSGYKEKLSSTPEPLRSMLLDGRFGIKLADHAMQVIPTNWVLMAQERWNDKQERLDRNDPNEQIYPMLVLAGDIAQGGLDTTVLAALREDSFYDEMIVQAGDKTPTGIEVTNMILQERKDKALIVLDGTGGWGGSTRDLLLTHHDISAVLHVSSEAAHEWSKENNWKFLNKRAAMWWRFREALDPKSSHAIMLPPSDALVAQLTAPHYGLRGNVVVVESKDDLRKRLGTSTDEADAVLMAWSQRARAIAERHEVDPIPVELGGWNVDAQKRLNNRRHSVELADPLADWEV